MSISSSRLFAAVAAACVAGAGLTAPAHAEDVRTVTVNYKDLNLQSAKGQKQLARRVAYAASVVCTQPNTDSQMQRDAEACLTTTKAQAAADLAKAGIPGA